MSRYEGRDGGGERTDIGDDTTGRHERQNDIIGVSEKRDERKRDETREERDEDMATKWMR